MLGAAPQDEWCQNWLGSHRRRRGTRNPARRGPLSTPHLHSSTHMPSSCRHWICCGIGGIALCSRGTATCSLSIVPLVYTINSAALHHVSGDEMMERCTAYSTVASGASAEALIETSRCFLATCCSGKRAIGAARQAVPLSLSGDGHLHAMVSLRSVWWCRAAFCCSAIATAQWSCSGGSQSRLLSASFWRGLHLPVYLGLWPVLGLTAPHVIFVRIWRFGASKPEKNSGLAGATVTGVSLRKSQVKVIHLMGTSPKGQTYSFTPPADL